MTLGKFGGIAAIIAALTYIFGFVLMVSVLAPAGYGDDATGQDHLVNFIVQNRYLMYVWFLTIYIINAVFLLILAVALFDRLKQGAAGLAQVSLAFGTLWATLVLGAGMVANVGLGEVAALYASEPGKAIDLWKIVSTIENGLGGGNEIAGGVWVLCLGLAGLISAALPRFLNYFSLIIGVAGLATVIPGLSEIGGAIFGLGFIAWFIWVGIVLLRD